MLTITLNDTRQLDYYKNLSVTCSNLDAVIKKYNGTDFRWWLRSPLYSNRTSYKLFWEKILYYGAANEDSATALRGVSPAFRIG